MGIEFEIFEGLVFNKPSLKSPEFRGPFTVQKSYVLPLPTTILGTIVTALNLKSYNDIDWSNSENVLEVFRNYLGEFEFFGPYLKVKNNKESKIYVNLNERLIRIEDLYTKISNIIKELSKEKGDFENRIKRYFDRKRKRIIFPKESQFQLHAINKIGICLEKGDVKNIGAKYVREGYLYTQEVLFYTSDISRYRICLDAKKCDKNKIKDVDGKIVRFGGEGRISKIEVTDKSGLLKYIEEKVKPSNYHVLMSYAIVDVEIKDYSDYSSIMNQLRNELLNRYGFEIITGELHTQSLGWDLKNDRLKPYYILISPGSIIKLKQSTHHENVGLFKEFGFGSCISLGV